MSIHHQLPLYSRLFVLYLITVATMTLVRSSVLVRDLRLLGKMVRRDPEEEARFTFLWNRCWAKLQAMKRSVFLTLLLAILVAADQVRTDFVSVAVQKTAGVAALSGGFVEVLAVFTLGILACVAIYAIYALCVGSLIRRSHRVQMPQGQDGFPRDPEAEGI
jgi:hypothetical protein